MPSHTQTYIMKHILNLPTGHWVACQTYLLPTFLPVKAGCRAVGVAPSQAGYLYILQEHCISVLRAKARASPYAIEKAFA